MIKLSTPFHIRPNNPCQKIFRSFSELSSVLLYNILDFTGLIFASNAQDMMDCGSFVRLYNNFKRIIQKFYILHAVAESDFIPPSI